MRAESWQRVKEVFHQALEHPPAARPAFVEGVAAGDRQVTARVLALLAAHEATPEAWLAAGAVSALRDELQLAVTGLRIGSYRVLSELGRGGMGVVYLAERDDGAYRQKVALKVLKRGMDTDEVVRRFLAERQILAALSHPNIARLLDGGSTADGRPYFALEHVEGRPIDAYADALELGAEARVRLFLPIVHALQYAHRNLVVHRDLKPANILVGDDGVAKLLDFGIAKILAASGPLSPQAPTVLGLRPMTPDYASPEQRAGGAITTATDVHGLGLILYELLLGQSPAAVERELGAGWAGRPAGQALRALGARQGGRRSPRLAADLEAIVEKARDREPHRRYGTAFELADDLERYLESRPVKARRPTFAYRLGRAVRRHKLAALFALSLLAFTGLVSGLALEIARQRDRAEEQRRQAEGLAGFLSSLFKAPTPEESRGQDLKASQLLDTGFRALAEPGGPVPSGLQEVIENRPRDAASRARLLQTIGEAYHNLGFFDRAERAFRRSLAWSAGLPAAGSNRAATLTGLAHTRRELGAWEESERLYRQALRLEAPAAGEGALAADSLNGLGLLYLATDRPAEAGAAFTRAEALLRRQGPAARRRRLETLSNLALVATRQGRPATALARLEEALAIRQDFGGDDDPSLATLWTNRGEAFYRLGNLAAAERDFTAALALRRRLLAPDHPDLASSLHNLGVLKLRQGQAAAAERALREALALYERRPAASQLDRAETIESLSLLREGEGDLREAESLSVKSLALYRGGGESGPKLGELLTRLGDLRRRRRAFEGSFAAYREAIDLRRRTLGREHLDVTRSLIGLGNALVEAGRAREAEPYLAEGLALRRRNPAAGAYLVARAEGSMGACLLAQGRLAEAAPLLASSHRTLVRERGDGDPETLLAADRLRRLARRRGGPR